MSQSGSQKRGQILMNKDSMKVGKKQEATQEELEFIYQRLPKLSDREIKVEMEDEGFTERSLGFIKRRRIEFNVANKTIAKKATGAYDIDIVEQKRKHMKRLSEKTEEFIIALRRISRTVSGSPYSLLEMGVENDDFELLELLNDFHVKWMFSHMKDEIPALKDLSSWEGLKVKDITQELLGKLSFRAECGDFPNKCEICEDWD